MNKRFISAVLVLIAAIAGFLLYQKIDGTTQHSAAPLTQRVYVWQRIQTTAEVATAIDSVPNQITGILPLVAEVHFKNGTAAPPEIIRPSLAIASLKKRTEGEGADAAVIRIGISAAETGWNPAACEIVESLAGEFLSSSIWTPRELQIDYDCPQKRLADYGKLLAHLKAAFPGVPLTFTALPSWLGEPEFAEIAAITDSYVLQVHSLQLPSDPSQKVELINHPAARAAVEQAGKIGHPFEVALPTYSCLVVFEKGSDRVFDVISEDLPRQWPQSTGGIKLGETDPAAMVELLQKWQKSHPSAMRGLIWYRLPVETDVMNWSPLVWRKVVQGETPVSQSEFEVLHENSRSTIVFKNTGETTVHRPGIVSLKISGTGEYHFDGSLGYLGEGDPLKFVLKPGPFDSLPLPPGESTTIGWIEGDVTVEARAGDFVKGSK